MKTVLKTLASPLLAVTGLLKKPKLPSPIGTPTRDEARDIIINEDALRRRRGGAADMLTGATGAEAAPTSGGKATLGS